MNLNVDTSWYLRYRSSGNPDFGNTFGQVVTIKNRPAIPLHDNYTANQIQAIANTAAFYFGTIEQGGTSLYPELSLNVTSLEVLRIVTSIGPSEAWHLAIWDDTAGEIPAVNSGDGLVFPALPLPNNGHAHALHVPQREPAAVCGRPAHVRRPLPARWPFVKALMQSGLFIGQSPGFFTTLNQAGRRRCRRRHAKSSEVGGVPSCGRPEPQEPLAALPEAGSTVPAAQTGRQGNIRPRGWLRAAPICGSHLGDGVSLIEMPPSKSPEDVHRILCEGEACRMLAGTRHHTRVRRGIVLVLVLAMLGLLALIGVTFATFSGQARIKRATSRSRSSSRRTTS